MGHKPLIKIYKKSKKKKESACLVNEMTYGVNTCQIKYSNGYLKAKSWMNIKIKYVLKRLNTLKLYKFVPWAIISAHMNKHLLAVSAEYTVLGE